MGSPRTWELYGLRRARATALVNGSLTISILPPLTNGLPTLPARMSKGFSTQGLTTGFRAACASAGSIEVPRLRRPPRALAWIAPWSAPWIAASIALGPMASPASGQDGFGPYLMRPQLDGDPRNPPRFSRISSLDDGRQGFGYWPPRGKGKIGFESALQRRPKAQPARVPLRSAAAAAESANGPPALPTQPAQPAHSAAENPKQSLRQNPTQQPHAAAAANAAYPVGPLGDPPALPVRRRLLPDQDSFAPTGIEAGTFLLRP